jgi:Tfp pilus assembly major pilin PilA
MLMKLHKPLSKQRGIGLLELMLSIAIIAILLIMATRYYKNTNLAQRIANTMSIVGGVIGAETQYSVLNSGVYTSDWLALNIGQPNSPWGGGTVKLTGTTDSSVIIGVPNVDPTSCTGVLTTQIKAMGASVACPSSAGGTMTVTYQ